MDFKLLKLELEIIKNNIFVLMSNDFFKDQFELYDTLNLIKLELCEIERNLKKQRKLLECQKQKISMLSSLISISIFKIEKLKKSKVVKQGIVNKLFELRKKLIEISEY